MRKAEPEVVFLAVVLAFAILSRMLGISKVTNNIVNTQPKEEGTIRVCLALTPRSDVADVVQRYLSTSCKRYELAFSLLMMCDTMEDVQKTSYVSSPVERIFLHHTLTIPAEKHQKRHRKLFKKFVSGLESVVVFSDERAFPEFGWDLRIVEAFEIGSCKDDENGILTCPLCPHEAGFPTFRERSNGDVVRDDAKTFLNPGEPGVFVPSVCACNEFLAFPPQRALANQSPLSSSFRYWLPTFPILRSVLPTVEVDVLDANMDSQRSRLTNSEKLGLTPHASGDEMFHKYGSAAAAKLAIKMDRKKANEGS